MEVVCATSNAGKIREASAILAGTGFEIVSVPLWLGEVETGTSYLENARLKAASALRLAQMPVLAEDSGLELDALGGLPGLRSARFAGAGATAERNNAKLLRLLDGVPDQERTARYRAVAVLLLPSGAELVGEGVWEGHIAAGPRGEGGFGYDPLFVPSGETRTAAELSEAEKNEISHRSRALRDLVERAQKAGVTG